MATTAQIAANRRNAQKSTGPRTAAGKAASRMNAMRSGIHAEELVIRGEFPDELERLTAEYYDEFDPVTPRERDLVDTIIRNEWIVRRMGLVEAQLWGHQFQHNDSVRPPDRLAILKRNWPLGQAFVAVSGQFERLQRRISSLERSTRRAQQELAELRSQRERAAGEHCEEQPGEQHHEHTGSVSEAPPALAAAAQPAEPETAEAPIGFVPSISPELAPSPSAPPNKQARFTNRPILPS
ncbi:MAG TPA: hypothetical protein VKX45_19965 [Bryobacteraceae bacterium]|jgi:PHD/YefM family antitoxin component YafN of YafNO toxin-antitoxin module|nr:hypothetical protein [Bryobacteraceae bacterium]